MRVGAILVGVGGLIALGVAGLRLRTPLDPVAWEPSEAVAATGVWAPNRALVDVERLELPGVSGPEDVAVVGDRWVTGVAGGDLLATPLSGGTAERWVNTGGRALGLDVDAGGRLIVADGERGLLGVDPHGHVEVLCDTAGGVPVHFADDVEVGPDGVAWFSDATQRFELSDWKDDLIENRTTGRLLAVDLATGRCWVALDGLAFANGVAVDAQNRFVLVVETSRYRVRRLWLSGPKAGQDDVFVDGLPGFPDGLSRGAGGRFWLAVPAPRNAVVDALAGWPWLRSLIGGLPASVQPSPSPFAMVVGLSAEGQVTHVLQDAEAATFSTITSVQEANGTLWLGSLTGSAVGRVPAP